MRKQGQQALFLAQTRTASQKASTAIPRPLKAAKSSSALTSAATSNNAAAKNSNSSARMNRKTNKAKAQASASRALREELASIVQKDEGSSKSSQVNTAILEKARKEDEVAQNVNDQPIRRLNDAIAFATAESYDLKKLIASNRLPAGWQLLEDDETIHIPHWPQQHSSSSSSSGSGEVFVFQSGSYVTWGLNKEQSSRFLRYVLQGKAGKGQSVEVEPYKDIGDEEMEYIVADDQ